MFGWEYNWPLWLVYVDSFHGVMNERMGSLGELGGKGQHIKGPFCFLVILLHVLDMVLC
jgi:hypothetical protein